MARRGPSLRGPAQPARVARSSSGTVVPMLGYWAGCAALASRVRCTSHGSRAAGTDEKNHNRSAIFPMIWLHLDHSVAKSAPLRHIRSPSGPMATRSGLCGPSPRERRSGKWPLSAWTPRGPRRWDRRSACRPPVPPLREFFNGIAVDDGAAPRAGRQPYGPIRSYLEGSRQVPLEEPGGSGQVPREGEIG
jgi:hypothetical protein